jgi:hypothetical protein
MSQPSGVFAGGPDSLAGQSPACANPPGRTSSAERGRIIVAEALDYGSDSGTNDWRPWTVPNHSGLVASPAVVRGFGERAHIVGT